MFESHLRQLISGEVVLWLWLFVVFYCLVFISISLVELSCTSLSLEFGVIGGLVTPSY